MHNELNKINCIEYSLFRMSIKNTKGVRVLALLADGQNEIISSGDKTHLINFFSFYHKKCCFCEWFLKKQISIPQQIKILNNIFILISALVILGCK